MRKSLPINVYTQINTDPDTYIIQNVSTSESIYIVVSATQPAANTDYDFVIKPLCGLTGSHVSGLAWGKPNGKTPVTVGIVEG